MNVSVDYSNAKYIEDLLGQTPSIQVEINGVVSRVPLDPLNRDYAAIMSLVASGDLIITPAE